MQYTEHIQRLPRDARLLLMAKFIASQQHIWPITVAFAALYYDVATVGV